MQAILIVGIIIFVGFLCGEIAAKLKFPKVTGYILAGILLNPGLLKIIPADFVDQTQAVTNIALSLITFSVGGTLLYSRVKKLGKSILCITIFEAELAFAAVTLGFLIILPFFTPAGGANWLNTFIPVSILMAALASPTDPTATLAVAHEYRAKGAVTSTIMGVAAFDDVTGIINYSIAVVIAQACIMHSAFNGYSTIVKPLVVIFGAVLLGALFGFIFNLICRYIKRETEGVFIVLIIGLLSLCFGCATLLGVEELLATMSMGAVVVNFNERRDRIFQMLERYTEELIFVLFFTLSGMHLKFAVLIHSFPLVILFVIFRTIGKVAGAVTGAFVSRASANVKKYAAGGLIPQGGIVVGLALMMKQNQAFAAFSDLIIGVIIGATVIHELIGPVFARLALVKSGEIKKA